MTKELLSRAISLSAVAGWAIHQSGMALNWDVANIADCIRCNKLIDEADLSDTLAQMPSTERYRLFASTSLRYTIHIFVAFLTQKLTHHYDKSLLLLLLLSCVGVAEAALEQQASIQPGVSEEALRQFSIMFRHFDGENLGRLDRQQFKICLRTLGYDVPLVDEGQPELKFQRIVDMVDQNRDGYFTLQECMALLTENVRSSDEVERRVKQMRYNFDEQTQTMEPWVKERIEDKRTVTCEPTTEAQENTTQAATTTQAPATTEPTTTTQQPTEEEKKPKIVPFFVGTAVAVILALALGAGTIKKSKNLEKKLREPLPKLVLEPQPQQPKLEQGKDDESQQQDNRTWADNEGMSHVAPNGVPYVAQNGVLDVAPNGLPGVAPNGVPDVAPNGLPGVAPNCVPDVAPNGFPDNVPYDVPEG